jgi:hypothetical protein
MLSAGEITPFGVRRLHEGGILGKKYTGKYIKGLQRGNRALMKRHGIVGGGMNWGGFKGNAANRSITGGGTYKGKPRSVSRQSVPTRAANAALATRHEINEVLLGSRKFRQMKRRPKSPQVKQKEEFLDDFGHYDPDVIIRESRHLRHLPGGTQAEFTRMRRTGGESKVFAKSGTEYQNLYSTSAKQRKATSKKALERKTSPVTAPTSRTGRGSLLPDSPDYLMAPKQWGPKEKALWAAEQKKRGKRYYKPTTS